MKLTLYVLCALLASVLVAARLGLFAGQPPSDLGVVEGRLKPPSATRNSVSSQVHLHPGHGQTEYARIAPLALLDHDPTASMQALVSVLAGRPEIHLVRREHDYLYAQATTRWLRFVDDLEFWLDPQAGAIQVRSASRLGREDFGVNRQRLESIRAAYQARARN